VAEASSPPGAPSIDEVAARVVQLNRLHRHAQGTAPAWLDQEMTFSQLRLLVLLREEGPLPMSRLAAALGVTPATASGAIDRIERRGLAERCHRGDDRRVVECALTGQGEDLVRAMTEAHVDQVKQLLALFTPAELADFDRLIAAVIERATARPTDS
jgi:DNA-binding MarR family transcriptional regulator